MLACEWSGIPVEARSRQTVDLSGAATCCTTSHESENIMTTFVQSGPDAGNPIGTPFPDEIGKVLANFYVDSVTERAGGYFSVTLKAVTKGPNNWSKYSPAGTIELTTVNSKAADWFKAHLGSDTRVTFDDIPTQDAE